MKAVIAVYQCPQHKDFVSLCVDLPDGGTRVLGGKCCVRQYEKRLRVWTLTRQVAQELTEEMENALEEAERPAPKEPAR